MYCRCRDHLSLRFEASGWGGRLCPPTTPHFLHNSYVSGLSFSPATPLHHPDSPLRRRGELVVLSSQPRTAQLVCARWWRPPCVRVLQSSPQTQLQSVSARAALTENGAALPHRHSCIDDLRISGRSAPLPRQLTNTPWGQASVFKGVERGCVAPSACTNVSCRPRTLR
ncbi:Neural-cadherin [Chionoecetes opilio]|uniref:Neural-cadherin n=1 Tax=Chionoecetes opilio TaxID=41210 RepID=A0A8J4YI72_CHIOP|nr:Neural-cadherin [Chionoecetes opilio]